MRKKNSSNSHPPLREKCLEAAGLLIILGALFVFVSLITYDPADFAYGVYPANSHVENKGGPLGATLAEFLFRFLGLAAIPAAAIVAAWGILLFFQKKGRPLVLRLIGSLLALYATAILLALQPIVLPESVGLETAMPSLGGVYGTIGCIVLTKAIGPWGTFLAALLAYGVSIVIATRWMPHQLVQILWNAGEAFGGWLVRNARPVVAAMRPAPVPADDAGQSPSRRAPDSAARAELRDCGSEDMEPSVARSRSAGQAAFSVAPPTRRRTTGPATAGAPPTREADVELHPLSSPRTTDAAARRAPAAEPEPPAPRTLISVSSTEPPRMPEPVRPSRLRDAKPRVLDNFNLPPIDFFEDVKARNPIVADLDTEGTSRKIEDVLAQFNIPVKVTGCQHGPIITEYHLEPAPGIKLNRIFGMHDEVGLALHAPSVRIVGPIPNKGVVVEVPNPFPETVRMRSLLAQTADQWQSMPLPMLLGKDTAGRPLVRSLSEFPHLLVAGTTGSGKSICLNAIITSFLVSMPPTHLKLILVDPKMVEFPVYKEIPHLWAPVLTDMKHEVPMVLEWLCREMDERYETLSAVAAKNIVSFNRLTPEEIRNRLQKTGRTIPDPLPDRLPYVVLVIDEFGELMNVAAKEVELFVQRLAQKARAVGIHVVLATQHPSTDVVSGVIRANFPARIAFQVMSQVNSRVVLDRNGAERLLGKGDMLVLLPGMPEPIRGQGTYLDEKEVQSVVEFLRRQGGPQYHEELVEATRPEGAKLEDEPISDEMFDEAVRVILSTQRGSVSLLQRRLGIGFARAARLIDMMAERGVVGAYQGSKARDVMMTLEEWEGLRTPAAQS